VRGEVLLDGVRYKDMNVRALRSHIGYVGQEPMVRYSSVETAGA
jgi:ABC-type bacteriocin/lantibiotic exporter with double-glycine peptidase domain